MPSSPTSIMRLDLALRAIASTGGEPVPRRFLDVGTGEGAFLVELAKRGFEGLSVDVSEEALERARRQLEAAGVTSVRTECRDLYDLQDTAPLVLCFEVLEHLEDDTRALRRLAELVEPGGRLVVTVPARPDLWGPSDELTGHVRRYERKELTDRLTSAGLEVEVIWSVGFPLANALIAFRRRLARDRAQAETRSTDRETRTRRSSYARSLGIGEDWWAVLFNRVTLYPALLIQRAFVTSPRGAGLIAVARRR